MPCTGAEEQQPEKEVEEEVAVNDEGEDGEGDNEEEPPEELSEEALNMAASLAAYEAAEEAGEAVPTPQKAVAEVEADPVIVEEPSEAPAPPAATEQQGNPPAPAAPEGEEDNYEEEGFEEAVPSSLFPPSAVPSIALNPHPQRKASVTLPVSGHQSLPIRMYLDTTIVPVLRTGLRELVKSRPADPFEFLAAYILKNKPKS